MKRTRWKRTNATVELCEPSQPSSSESRYAVTISYQLEGELYLTDFISDQPLSEIAYASGFRDYTHFARKFRYRFGHAPGAHSARNGADVMPAMSQDRVLPKAEVGHLR